LPARSSAGPYNTKHHKMLHKQQLHCSVTILHFNLCIPSSPFNCCKMYLHHCNLLFRLVIHAAVGPQPSRCSSSASFSSATTLNWTAHSTTRLRSCQPGQR
jgi:hypothetical protein